MKKLSKILLFGALLAIIFACEDDKCDNHSATVHIEKTEEGYSLIRNGEKFYIKGGATKAEYLEELKEAGANTARIYDTLYLQRTLDKAHSLDLAVVVDIPIPKYYANLKYYEEREYFLLVKEKVRNIVEKHHNHPALLYWNLGNEIYYPYIYKNTNFFSNYNELIDLIHELDPNHPVSTSTIGANKYRVLTIITKSPQLDFISFNAFGNLTRFSDLLEPISPIWDGPHVISEWGVNGPWEADFTKWEAPIEETSTKKAEQIRERYQNYIKPIKEKGSLGSFIFYWARKNEFTPTWYSIFNNNKLKTEAAFEMDNIWKGENRNYPGPQLDYMLLNELGANQSIILSPEQNVQAEVFLPENRDQELRYHWEVRKEAWYKTSESKIEPNINFQRKGKSVNFQTPKKEGPYRLFVYLTNGTEYYATANIPFYVLKPNDEE